nr:EAL domain-containing protein [Chromobacterium sp. ASV5]
MKRFKQAKALPAGFRQAWLDDCQQLLARHGVAAQLCWNEREAFAAFDGWWLSSGFGKVAVLRGEACRLALHAARLRIHGQFGQALPAGWLFAMNYAEHRAVALLKLIRTLHLLNHAGRNGLGSPLRVDVDPRICQAHSGRIVDFTFELAATLGMPGQNLQCLLFVDQDTEADAEALAQAYRQRGCRLGLGGFGSQARDLLRLWRLEPDFLALAPRLLRSAIMYPQVRDQLLRLMPQLIGQGFELAVEEVACGNMLSLARRMGATYVAGPHLAALIGNNAQMESKALQEG